MKVCRYERVNVFNLHNFYTFGRSYPNPPTFSSMQASTPKAPDHAGALLETAKRFGTPTYVYAEATLRRQCERLRRHLSGLPTKLLYAMKANTSPALLRIIRDEGLGLDAVSPGELALALRLGFAPENILFSANNMTDEEMHMAHESGVLLNIGERTRLEAYGRAYPGADVCVRINPKIGAGHHEHVITAGKRSKFGVPVEEISDVQRIAQAHGLRIVGLHQHIGSGILEADRLWQASRVLLEAAVHFPDVRFLNLGGGLGIPYRPGEHPVDHDDVQRRLAEPLQAFAREHLAPDVRFWFEPGRFLVAEAGTLLVRVNTIKTAYGRVYAGTDSGMGHLVRPTVYGAYHAVTNLSNPDGPLRPYDVAGNICESGDLFAKERAVQEIREGDVLALLDAGAYGMAMASEYNLRPLPAEVMISSDGTPHLTRRRVSPTELAGRLLEEDEVAVMDRSA